MKPLRVLHTPTTVGGHPSGLSRAERELGLESKLVIEQQTSYQYACDEILCHPTDRERTREWKRWKLLTRAVKEFDVVHLNFGSPILSYYDESPRAFTMTGRARAILRRAYVQAVGFRDIQLLSYLNKVIAVTYQGDDARQGDYQRTHFAINIADHVEDTYYTETSDRRKQNAIRQFDRWADLIYALNPDLLHVLPSRAKFVPYAHVDPREWKFIDKKIGERRLIVHAPTHRNVKGTPLILETLSRLKSDGLDFDFILVEGLSHQAARKLYESADILIDQLYAGWYGGLAVELMALGKGVLTYLRYEDFKYLPAKMVEEIPIKSVTADSLYSTLKQVLRAPSSELEDWGRRSRKYMEDYHDPRLIASRLKNDYDQASKSKKIVK